MTAKPNIQPAPRSRRLPATRAVGGTRIRDDSPIGARVASVQAVVAYYYGVQPGHLRARTRQAAITWPRQVAMWLCREQLGMTVADVGTAFGRAHTTVLHSLEVVQERRSVLPERAAEIEHLQTVIAATLRNPTDNGSSEGPTS